MIEMATLIAMTKLSLYFLLLQCCTNLALSQSLINFLPGFQGPLPFELETGYVGVGESEEVQLFYYFVKSERNPTDDPLLLWLTGGPGCSAFTAFAFEIGPVNFKVVEYNGSLPTLVLNPYSWTKVANILFVDSPVGTGFSYAKTPLASLTGDFIQVHQLSQFLRKWLADHPEFLSSPFYIGGDSYSGITVPALAQRISNENEKDIQPPINLQGYILGNPLTEPIVEQNSVIPFAHGMGLISDELYHSLQRTCGGQYAIIDPSNADCLNNIQAYYKSVSGIQIAQILEPICGFASPNPRELLTGHRRFLSQHPHQEIDDPEPLPPPFIGCRKIEGRWMRCSLGLPYTVEIGSSFSYHVNLSAKGYRALIYSGDHDMLVPFFGTQAWIRSLNYSIVDDWRQWFLQSQVAGYTRTYSNQMTFATVKGGGHTAPEYRPAECYAMFERWILHDPL
ncbi:serine carboxypeptidase-like 17 isoform X2 [Mangifera indica]|uniref:serine carboxypeptidase-like 17 isoform X2 n=1 Tax=Mangifera indica TaxID=29780 RepID=UPI001CFC3ED4|nr:serine carboxypeptidase-like 17 isoform X2 [Mangifera indica]